MSVDEELQTKDLKVIVESCPLL